MKKGKLVKLAVGSRELNTSFKKMTHFCQTRKTFRINFPPKGQKHRKNRHGYQKQILNTVMTHWNFPNSHADKAILQKPQGTRIDVTDLNKDTTVYLTSQLFSKKTQLWKTNTCVARWHNNCKNKVERKAPYKLFFQCLKNFKKPGTEQARECLNAFPRKQPGFEEKIAKKEKTQRRQVRKPYYN